MQKPVEQKKFFVPPPPLKRFDSFMLKMIQWANFLARVPSLDVDSSYEIQDGVQDGHQKVNFAYISYRKGRISIKKHFIYHFSLRSNKKA